MKTAEWSHVEEGIVSLVEDQQQAVDSESGNKPDLDTTQETSAYK